MSDQDLNDKTQQLNLNGSKTTKSGGGGGPSMSFKSSFKVGASEFVPSFTPQAPAAYQSGYGGQQQYGGYQQQYQGYQQQQYQGYQQQQYYGGYQQQYQGYQQQQYQEPQEQQQAYQASFAPKSFVPTMPKPKTAKAVSLSSGPAKSVSLSTGEAKTLSLSDSKTDAPAAEVPEQKEEKVEQKAEKSEPKPEPVAAAAEPAKKKSQENLKKAASIESSPKKVEVAAEPEAEAENIDPASMGTKEHLNIIFMGHVDAGKSTMGGHILFLTGMVDKRTMEKYEREAKELGRESWYLSWALDLNQEERNKGKTTEYGRGYFETETRRFTIIDAPGHKTFVPSMIGGAAQADVGVLVISARKGEFETGFEKGGQTREHALLAKTAGVKRLILVINKMDESTVQWSKERYDECVNKILPYLKAVGYGKDDVDVIPVSGYTGANLKDPLTKEVCPWFEGPSLLQLLDEMKLDRKYNGPLMMPIADKMKDMGTIVMGKIESGSVRKGASILIMPNKKTAEVTAIFQEDNEVGIAFSGDNIRLRLKGVEEEEVSSGFVICTPSRPIHAVAAFEAELAIVEYKSIICSGYTAVIHAHTAVEEITLAALLHSIDKKTRKKTKRPPQFLRQGDMAIVRLELSQNLCLETFADYPQLGRFTLRDEGKTVAIGKITKLIIE